MTKGLHGIVIHWTAGGGKVSDADREHYHFVVQQDGKIVAGDHEPEDNASTADDDYAGHTRLANTGRIGVGLCGMVGAKERPFSAGSAPINSGQVDMMCRFVADLCRRYGIPVTRQTVLTHAEVQPTLKIIQRGKWDICWLPGMDAPGDPLAVGDKLRAKITSYLAERA